MGDGDAAGGMNWDAGTPVDEGLSTVVTCGAALAAAGETSGSI